jgi:hypothetical protein
LIVDQVRGVRSSSGAPAGLSFLLHGAIFQPGESYPRTVGIGVRVPAAPPGRAGFRGLTSAKHTPRTPPLFVRRFTAEGGWPRGSRSRAIRGGGRPPSSWDRSSTGRAPDRQSGGSRFDSDRFHEGINVRCSGPESGVPVWYTGDGECNSREQLESRSVLVSRGGSSTVESEAAKLVMGVRFPSTALSVAGIVQR